MLMQSILIFMVLVQLDKRTRLFEVCSMAMHSYAVLDVLLLYQVKCTE